MKIPNRLIKDLLCISVILPLLLASCSGVSEEVSVDSTDLVAQTSNSDDDSIASNSADVVEAEENGLTEKLAQLEQSTLVDSDLVSAPEMVFESGEVLVERVEMSQEGSDIKVLIETDKEAAFALKKVAQSEYVLELPAAIFSDDISKLQLGGDLEGQGIRSARVDDSQPGVAKVRMFVNAGTSLEATPRENLIVVSTLSELADVRAQVDSSESAASTTESKPPVEAFRSADGSKNYSGRLISLDLQDTDIDNALRIIAEVSGLNIIASDDVSGKVTLRLIDVPWDQALDVILRTNGLDFVREGNVLRIAPIERLRQEREALLQARQAAESLEDLSVQYIRISYARASDVQPAVESVLTERGSATADERTNQLIIRDIEKGQKAATEIVKKLDLRTPQILLETQIVEANRSLLRDLGFNFNFTYNQGPQFGNSRGANFPSAVSTTTSSSFPVTLTDTPATIAGILDSADGSKILNFGLQAYEQEGLARVVSRPQVATVNNQAARIKSVETIRVPTPASGTVVSTGAGGSAGGANAAFEEFEVGITLDVTPQASPDYYVLLDVEATSSTFGTRELDGIPSTIDRTATSTVLVKDGQTFALGGVYRVNDSDTITGVPFLKDVPFLGQFFRSSAIELTDEELIFFITPHIVEGSFDSDFIGETSELE